MDGGGCDASVCQVINQEGMTMGARSENQAKSFKVNRIFQLGLGIFVVLVGQPLTLMDFPIL
jgi:hypothetical protein